jgi:hypothetical protein
MDPTDLDFYTACVAGLTTFVVTASKTTSLFLRTKTVYLDTNLEY